jgi:hypothetical protein
MLPVAVNVYILKPPVVVTVGEPVVEVAKGNVSGYLIITTPEPPAVDAPEPNPEFPPFPLLTVAVAPVAFEPLPAGEPLPPVE